MNSLCLTVCLILVNTLGAVFSSFCFFTLSSFVSSFFPVSFHPLIFLFWVINFLFINYLLFCDWFFKRRNINARYYWLIILSDNCRWLFPIGSLNLWNIDLQRTACLIDVTRGCEVGENNPSAFSKYAVHWTETRGPRLTADFHSGECCAACRPAKWTEWSSVPPKIMFVYRISNVKYNNNYTSVFPNKPKVLVVNFSGHVFRN
jgi:hypothetical protein